jgi:hypothetical protein
MRGLPNCVVDSTTDLKIPRQRIYGRNSAAPARGSDISIERETMLHGLGLGLLLRLNWSDWSQRCIELFMHRRNASGEIGWDP